MKIFLDVGFYAGKALDYYVPLMDESWKVYVFEPNTNLDVEESLKKYPFKAEWIKKAVWIEDGFVDFTLGNRDDASHISSMQGTPGHKVPCLDFSKFVKNLPEDAIIVCSFDAEGAEFEVLSKMLREAVAPKIDLLDIEFHHRITGRDTQEASRLRIALESVGVLVKTKLDL